MNKFLCVLLAVVMVAGFLPATALAAEEYPVWVGETQVTGDRLSGEGWSYDPDTNTLTLTLTDYSNSGAHYTEPEAGVYDDTHGYRMAAGIYCAGTEKLTVKLEGENTLTMPEFSENKLDNAAIFAKGDIVFSGEGSLTATGGAASDSSEESNVGSFGLCVGGKTTAFEGSGAVTFAAADGESSYGVYAAKGGITVTGGNITAIGGNGKHSCGIYGISTTGSNIIVSGGTLTAVGGNATKKSCGIGSEWGGVIVKDGGKLTATGGAVRGDSGRSCGIEDGIYDINVENGILVAKGGDVAGEKGQSCGVYAAIASLSFEEDAQVTCEGGTVTGGQSESFGVRCTGFFVNGGEIEVAGGKADHSCGVYNSVVVRVDSGRLTTTGGAAKRSHGIYADHADVEVNGGTLASAGGEAAESSASTWQRMNTGTAPSSGSSPSPAGNLPPPARAAACSATRRLTAKQS